MKKILAALAVALAFVPAARATVLVPAELGELVRESQAIVHGRVADVTAVWADGRRRIDSLVTIEVREYLKGDLGAQVTIRVPGGQIGRYRSVMVGAPAFAEGDEVVLLLGARGPSYPYVLGLSQGVFRVVEDPQTRARLVVPPPLVAGVEVQAVKRGDGARRPLPLDRFTAEVRALVAGGPR
jgi:hypothetical protein